MSDVVIRVQDKAVKRMNTALGELAETMGQGRLENDYPWLVFLLKDMEYAINAKYVARVAVLYEIVPFLDTPVYCPGVIWDREGMIRLLDLRALFGQGDYLSDIKNEQNSLPMIIVIGLNEKRRGVIVDKILAIGYFGALTEPFADPDSARARYMQGTVKYDPLKAPALAVNPKSFRAVEFENAGARIGWNERVDMTLRIQESL